jgi:chaperone LolA
MLKNNVMKSFRVLLVVAVIFLPCLGAAQELDVQDQPLRQFLEGLKSFSAGFEQTLYSEFGEELEHSVGTVYIQRPGKFQWAYFEPYNQSIISDGEALWIYDADLEQATVKDASHSLGDSPASILDGSGDLDAHYVVINTGAQGAVQWLELTPRDADSDYNTIRLGFTGNDLSGMVLYDNLGQRTEITFKDARRNPKLDPALFTFAPPVGLDVIDSRVQP